MTAIARSSRSTARIPSSRSARSSPPRAQFTSRAATGCARGSSTSSTRSPTSIQGSPSMSRDVAQRLRRLLYLVPYVAKHPEGVPVEELAKKLGADRDEMLADLDLLSQVGPPDGDPGEYLLVSVEEGRVVVDLAHRRTRPLRLTPAEGCSLLLGLRSLRESGIAPFDQAMQSAEKKLHPAHGRDASAAL